MTEGNLHHVALRAFKRGWHTLRCLNAFGVPDVGLLVHKMQKTGGWNQQHSGLLFAREFPDQIELLCVWFPQLTGKKNNTLSYARRENAPIDGFPRIPLLCGSLWPNPIRVPLKRKEWLAKGHP